MIKLTELVIWAERWKSITHYCEPVECGGEKQSDSVEKNVTLWRKQTAAYSSMMGQQVVGTPSEHEHLSIGTRTRSVPQPETRAQCQLLLTGRNTYLLFTYVF